MKKKKKNYIWHIRLKIYILKTTFPSHNQYLFGLIFSRNLKKACTDQIILYSVWKETSHKRLKVAVAKKSFPSVYIIDTICFDECFSFHVISGRHYFLYKFNVTKRFGETPMLLCSLKKGFWKKSTFYIRSLHNSITMLLIPKMFNKLSTS